MKLNTTWSLLMSLSLFAGLSCQQQSAKSDSEVRVLDSEEDHADDVLTAECQETKIDPGAKRPFRKETSRSLVAAGQVSHHAADVLIREGEKINLKAHFAYAKFGSELLDEEVDVYFLYACGADWLKVGSFRTSGAVLPSDKGGNLSFELSELLPRPLGPGHYRIVFIVAGDHSSTELAIEVLKPETPLVVADIDGVLTSGQWKPETAAASSARYEAQPGAAAMLQAFLRRGYAIHYLTARPAWMTQASRLWLREKGFPEGVVRTSAAELSPEAGIEFKRDDLKQMREQLELVPCFAFGHKASDVSLFGEAGIQVSRSYYFDLVGDAAGGKTHKDYKSLLTLAQQAPLRCP